MRSRRDFLKSAAAAAATGLFPPGILRAMAIPADRRSGSIRDIDHVVVFMQENRAFDHYFGTLRGVRGFGDRFPIPLPGGRPVWHQVDAHGREILPFHLDTATTSAQRVEGLPHTWPDAQMAWNDGRMDQWLPAKGERTMGHYRREDIAYQFALAEAFTLCDAYHASMQTGTNPNRLFLWTGTNDPGGSGGGPAIVNTFDGPGPATEGYAWTTYPERLQQAGVSWRIYQAIGDNFECNPLEGFRQYRGAMPDSALFRNGVATWTLGQLAADVKAGTLPQVSWIVAPAKYSEHPGPSSPLWGAQYTEWVLDALTANPDVWGRTALLLMFDENDGFFDHVPPPAPPAQGVDGGKSTVALDDEYHLLRSGPSFGKSADPPKYYGRGYGLGPRVPCYVISPFSRGGWVNSQVFDHTSVIRFLETRFGVHEPNISQWRRAVCGDLTSAFDFDDPNRELPRLPSVADADTEVARQRALPRPKPPAKPHMPVQEQGMRRSRALPYALDVHGAVDASSGQLRLRFLNQGKAGAVFHVYDTKHGDRVPRRHTVEAGKQVDDAWLLSADGYDLRVHGPNGFFRRFVGEADEEATVEIGTELVGERLVLTLRNTGARDVRARLMDAYGQCTEETASVAAGRSLLREYPLDASGGWYDVTVEIAGSGRVWRMAGRLETGRHGISDPLM